MLLLDVCPSRSSLCFYLFLVYINDLPDKLTSNPKLFADDTTLFSKVIDPNATTNQINNDLHNMSFNPDTSKQAQELVFSRKIKITVHTQFVFSNNPVHENSTQKHLGMLLDFKLNFQEHFENMLIKLVKL